MKDIALKCLNPDPNVGSSRTEEVYFDTASGNCYKLFVVRDFQERPYKRYFLCSLSGSNPFELTDADIANGKLVVGRALEYGDGKFNTSCVLGILAVNITRGYNHDYFTHCKLVSDIRKEFESRRTSRQFSRSVSERIAHFVEMTKKIPDPS